MRILGHWSTALSTALACKASCRSGLKAVAPRLAVRNPVGVVGKMAWRNNTGDMASMQCSHVLPMLSPELLAEGHELGMRDLQIIQQLPAFILCQLIVGGQGMKFADPELDLLFADKIRWQLCDLQMLGHQPIGPKPLVLEDHWSVLMKQPQLCCKTSAVQLQGS